MTNWPYVITLFSTVAVFCACTWQLLLLQRVGTRKRDYAAWMLNASCLIIIAVGMLGIFIRDVARHDYVTPWYVLTVRIGLIVLFVYPWPNVGVRR